MLPSAGSQSTPTYLPAEQSQWLKAQVKAAKGAGKRIALFSHQQVMDDACFNAVLTAETNLTTLCLALTEPEPPWQLFTIAEDCGTVNGQAQGINPLLYNQTKDLLPSIDVWFWGHEHNLQVLPNAVKELAVGWIDS